MKLFIILLSLLTSLPSFAYDPSAELCPIEDQGAVAGNDFMLKLDSYLSTQLLGEVKFSLVDENCEKTGLFIDNENRKIVGRPLLPKIYHLRLRAQGDYGSASEVSFRLNVLANAQKKPVLRQTKPLSGLVAGLSFNFALDTFLTNPSDDDQVKYFIDRSKPHQAWLSINNNNQLTGIPDGDDAGKSLSVTIIARSNAGGDSKPLTLPFTVEPNPDKQPVIESFEFKVKAAKFFKTNLRDKVKVQGSATDDNTLTFRISHVTPQVPWLTIDDMDKTILLGDVPSDAVNKDFIITLMAETQEGGVSASQNVVMKVKTDPAMTPRFIQGRPKFPRIHAGNSFYYDFGAQGDDVQPSYKISPYTISFTPKTDHPMWIKLENNKLIIDEVPGNESGAKTIWLTLYNELGGASKPIELDIEVRGFINRLSEIKK